eukprot:s2475_g1.t1
MFDWDMDQHHCEISHESLHVASTPQLKTPRASCSHCRWMGQCQPFKAVDLSCPRCAKTWPAVHVDVAGKSWLEFLSASFFCETCRMEVKAVPCQTMRFWCGDLKCRNEQAILCDPWTEVPHLLSGRQQAHQFEECHILLLLRGCCAGAMCPLPLGRCYATETCLETDKGPVCVEQAEHVPNVSNTTWRLKRSVQLWLFLNLCGELDTRPNIQIPRPCLVGAMAAEPICIDLDDEDTWRPPDLLCELLLPQQGAPKWEEKKLGRTALSFSVVPEAGQGVRQHSVPSTVISHLTVESTSTIVLKLQEPVRWQVSAEGGDHLDHLALVTNEPEAARKMEKL